MRIRKQFLLGGSHHSHDDIHSIVQHLGIKFDQDETVDKWVALSLRRFLSTEAQELFKGNLLLPATEILYTDDLEPSDFSDDELVGEWRLDLRDQNLHAKGRCVVQTESRDAFYSRHGKFLSTDEGSCQVLLRTTDTSTERAFMDAYLLGDSRLKFAVTQAMKKVQGSQAKVSAGF